MSKNVSTQHQNCIKRYETAPKPSKKVTKCYHKRYQNDTKTALKHYENSVETIPMVQKWFLNGVKQYQNGTKMVPKRC